MLNETFAQLYLAMFGFEEKFVEKVNVPFRRAMAGRHLPGFVPRFVDEIARRRRFREQQYASRDPARTPQCPARPRGMSADDSGPKPQVCPAKEGGPLFKMFAESGFDKPVNNGNTLIFSFAGHDTTGHTLTWLVFELCKHPRYQETLRAEVDAFWARRGYVRNSTRNPPSATLFGYEDLQELRFMTRVITETLRLWPAVANGSFRQLQFEDTITGRGGKPVTLPAGTFVQIQHWTRHRNPDLWGEDCNEFNPYRDFEGDEIWNHDVFRAYNPASHRFAPFTHPPRDCIGKNFAQLEMRTILLHIIRDFRFELAEPTRSHDPNRYLGINYGTLAPADNSMKSRLVTNIGKRWLPGMFVYATPRR